MLDGGKDHDPAPGFFPRSQVESSPLVERMSAYWGAPAVPPRPTDTTVSRGNEEMRWSLLLPADVGVYIPTLAAMAPGGVTLDVANNGRLVRIGSGMVRPSSSAECL
jgi:hypothetical protein